MQNNNNPIQIEVPEVVVQRLPIYVRVLSQLLESNVEVISSHQLGELLQMTPAQIRKDLSYFGRFGKQGRGYNIQFLLDELRQILGIDRAWKACLVGLGRLGRAIINYPGFSPEGFEIVAAFDNDVSQYDSRLGTISVQAMEEIARVDASASVTVDLSSTTTATAAITSLDTAIKNLAESIQKVGDFQARLSSKD